MSLKVGGIETLLDMDGEEFGIFFVTSVPSLIDDFFGFFSKVGSMINNYVDFFFKINGIVDYYFGQLKDTVSGFIESPSSLWDSIKDFFVNIFKFS